MIPAYKGTCFGAARSKDPYLRCMRWYALIVGTTHLSTDPTWKPTGGLGPLPVAISLYLRPEGSVTVSTFSSATVHSASHRILKSCGGREAARAVGCDLPSPKRCVMGIN